MRAALVATYLAAAVLALLPARVSWRYRAKSPRAPSLVALLVGIAAWSAAQALSVAVSAAPLKRTFNYLIYPGVCLVVAAYFWLAAVNAGYGHRLSRRVVNWLCVEPVLVAVAIAGDPWLHWFYRAGPPGPGPVLTVHPGPLYWAHTAYSYMVLTVAVGLVVLAMRRAVRGHRPLYVAFLLASTAPTVANVFTLTRDVHSQGVDFTPILFLVPAAAWLWNERRGSRLVPVAARQVLAALTDAVIVVDHFGRFLDVNPAATRLLSALAPGRADGFVGRPWREVVGDDLAARLTSGGQHTLTRRDGTVLDIRIASIDSTDGHQLGHVVVVRDVTELERLRADLADQASRDGLTGVHNRRYLDQVLRRVTGVPGNLAVVMVDVDHFKKVNDRYGHATGDDVLRFVADLLGEDAAPGDVVVRYGGEEFVVVLPGADATAAAERAEAWRRRCETSAVEGPDGPVSVTISAGVADRATAGGTERLLPLADAAMYTAKTTGRNRVQVAPLTPDRPRAYETTT